MGARATGLDCMNPSPQAEPTDALMSPLMASSANHIPEYTDNNIFEEAAMRACHYIKRPSYTPARSESSPTQSQPHKYTVRVPQTAGTCLIAAAEAAAATARCPSFPTDAANQVSPPGTRLDSGCSRSPDAPQMLRSYGTLCQDSEAPLCVSRALERLIIEHAAAGRIYTPN